MQNCTLHVSLHVNIDISSECTCIFTRTRTLHASRLRYFVHADTQGLEYPKHEDDIDSTNHPFSFQIDEHESYLFLARTLVRRVANNSN